jgi:hypothetical protein
MSVKTIGRSAIDGNAAGFNDGEFGFDDLDPF